MIQLTRKFVVMVLAATLGLGASMAPVASAETQNTFLYCDVVTNTFYASPVLWGHETGIVRGLDENYFAPNQPVTRGQFVTLLHRYDTWAKGQAPIIRVTNPFVDVPSGAYYEIPVRWAVQKSITQGIDATHFQPDAPATRAETAAFLHRYNGAPTVPYRPEFTDVPKSAWFSQPVSWLVKAQITAGTSANQFSPGQLTTRAQVVTFLWRMAGSPNPTELPVARNCRNTFTAIGDSVMLGAVLSNDFTGTSVPNWSGTVEAQVCRLTNEAHRYCTEDLLPSTLDVIRRHAAARTLGEVLIIHTGTPGPFTAATFDLLVQAAADADVIWFVNTQDRASWRDETNAVIADGVARWAPRRAIGLLDWFALTEANPSLLDPRDGTHLSGVGTKAFAALMKTALQP